MKVLVVGTYIPERFIGNINALSIPSAAVSVASVKYTRLIYDGFKNHLGDDCTGAFLIPIGMFPASKILCWNPGERRERYLPFVNILVLKQISIAISLAYLIVRWGLANRSEKKLVVFTSIYLPFLAGSVPLKKLLDLRLVSFVPDLPEFEFTYTSAVRSVKRLLVPLYVGLTQRTFAALDYLVLITAAMRTKFRDKPSSIIEGFVDLPRAKAAQTKDEGQKKAVMYAGALLDKFGIAELLEAFCSLPGDYELWLFGRGEMEAPIREAAERDPRIKLWGHQPNKVVLAFQRRARLLVNPRPSSDEFTKYSFPSKLLEYMASGTPVLTTRLQGIPEDYNDKMYYFADETAAGMRRALKDCLLKSDSELSKFGRASQSYVLAEKNNIKQIATLLERLQHL